jgi:CheY-like chemotaxis protein
MIGYGLAIAGPAAAVAVDLALQPILHPTYEPLLLLAVAAAALLGGLGPGLLALVLSTAALNWWFFPPHRAFGFETHPDLVRQLVFAVSGLVIAVLGARSRALARMAEARAGEAEFLLESAEGRLAQVKRRRSSGSRRTEPAAELVLAPARAEAAAATPDPAIDRKSDETVLIVDPDSEARQLASRTVEAAGYRWVSACDGVEALELLDRYDVPFALVVAEVGLPDIPGPELMLQIAARRPGLPVLYTSMSPRDDQPVLEKPFTPDELLRRTREILGKAGG